MLDMEPVFQRQVVLHGWPCSLAELLAVVFSQSTPTSKRDERHRPSNIVANLAARLLVTGKSLLRGVPFLRMEIVCLVCGDEVYASSKAVKSKKLAHAATSCRSRAPDLYLKRTALPMVLYLTSTAL